MDSIENKVNGNGVTPAGEKDESHLFVMLTQASYDALQEVVKLATDRGLESSFDHWLADAIKSGTNARTRTWLDRDKVTLFNEAMKGNVKAIAKLQKLIADKASQ
jgi:hypothetical protein